jgi:UDP-N-acetylglucosamine:LPS N-acetylglucosamine transferase
VVAEVLDDPVQRQQMDEAARSMARPDAARRIAEDVLAIAAAQ